MKKLFAVLGDPIGHSMSPMMHNDLFSYYNIDAAYLPFQVTSDRLNVAVEGLRALGARGFNVTVPHKSAIIPYLDKVDELAMNIGAVNTVVNEDGMLIGYNTDGPGFLRGLEGHIPSLSGQRVLIIGAGGAARAIYFTLAQKAPLSIDIANRTLEKAVNLTAECPFAVSSKAVSLEDAHQELNQYDLIVQTTMIGMYPKVSVQPVQLAKLKQQAMVCDIIYNPLETQFLQEAKRKGARVQNGIEMFVNQGALAFEKWTGIFPDVQRMRENVLKLLGGENNADR